MLFYSAWEDVVYSTSATNSPFGYYIAINDAGEEQVIFNGKAYAKPLAEFIDININEICKNYLSNTLSDAFVLGTSSVNDCYSAIRTFNLYNDDGSLLEQYTFLDDWSYDFTFRGDTNIGASLSRPINNRFDINRINNSYNTTIQKDGNGYYLHTVKNSNNYTDSCCGDIDILYKNRYGGWDKLLISLNPERVDNYTFYNIQNPYNNKSLQFGKRNYLNDIATTYNITTDILTEQQGHNLAFNLLSSNMVYYLDYKKNIYKPAIISGNSSTYQLYRNQGIIRYSFNIELSQSEQNI